MKKIIFIPVILATLCSTVFGFSPLKGVKIHKLSNGFTYILKEDHAQPIVSAHVWVRVGSIDENDRLNGISHFFEHMIFKGSAHYPAGEMSRRVESLGGIINAATSMEYTFYYMNTPSYAMKDTIAMLADAMQYCTFPADELEKERQIVLEEISRRYDEPRTEVWDGLMTHIYETTPYRYRVIGTPENIRSLSREDLLQFYTAHYRPDNMVLILVGDFRSSEAKKLIKKYFNPFKPRMKTPLPDLIEKKRPSYQVHISSRSVSQTYLALGFLGPVLDHADQFSVDVLAAILGSGRSSRLYRHVREEQRLVWSISAHFNTFIGNGLFVINATCAPGNRDEAILSITREIEEIIHNPPTKQEIDRAKTYITSTWIFNNETYHAQASTIGYFAVIDRLKILKKYLKKINRVTVSEIQHAAQKYLTIDSMTVSIVHPK